jgi:hypothetical protein
MTRLGYRFSQIKKIALQERVGVLFRRGIAETLQRRGGLQRSYVSTTYAYFRQIAGSSPCLQRKLQERFSSERDVFFREKILQTFSAGDKRLCQIAAGFWQVPMDEFSAVVRSPPAQGVRRSLKRQPARPQIGVSSQGSLRHAATTGAS